MAKSNNNTSGGVGFFGLLAIAFIVLKLCNQITWSWVWVLAPLWMPLTLVFVIIFLYYSIKAINIKIKHDRWRRNLDKMQAKDELEETETPKSLWQKRLDEIVAEQRKKSEKKKPDFYTDYYENFGKPNDDK